MMQSRNKKIATIGLLISVGIISGYIEFLFPLPIGIPGVKLGLSNIITLLSMCILGPFDTLLILVLRVVLSGLLFGNLFGLIYGLCGALCSYFGMLLLKKTGKFSIIGTSVFGGVIHNIAQLFVAVVLVSEIKLTFYLPVLLISGLICGLLVGFLSDLIVTRIKKVSEIQRDL